MDITRREEQRGARSESNFHLPTVSIEDDSSSIAETKPNGVSPQLPDVMETDTYVEVLDEKNEWKPKLVLENKTVTTTAAPSVIMRINPEKTDVELFNIEDAPFKEGKLKIPYEAFLRLRVQLSMQLSLNIR